MIDIKKIDKNTIIKVMMVLILALSLSSVYTLYQTHLLNEKYTQILEAEQQSEKANKQVLAMLTDIRNKQEAQQDSINKIHIQQEKYEMHSAVIQQLKYTGININTDLGVDSDKLTAKDIDKIIDYYNDHIPGGTPFKGKGAIFVKAGKETGLNPVYLFAHAAEESNFGKSYLGRTRNNYFGINAIDSNPNAAIAMGDSVDQGILDGAKWIATNYYDKGYTTLSEMNDSYASNSNWGNNISSIANTAISIL